MENEEKEQLAIRREALKGYDNFLLSIGFFLTFVVLERGLFVIDVILIALGAYFALKRSAGKGWTNKGNFHIINTVTGLDEDGNRWVVK